MSALVLNEMQVAPLYEFSNRRNYLVLFAFFTAWAAFWLFLLGTGLGTTEVDALLAVSFGAVAAASLIFGFVVSSRMSFYEGFVRVKIRSRGLEQIPYGDIAKVEIVPDEWSRSGYYLRVSFKVLGKEESYDVPKLIIYNNPQIPDPQRDALSLASWIRSKAGLPDEKFTPYGLKPDG
ncbi:MAG TPA: hypothetical protein VKF39_02615 [Nitrososphaerales archaeon]|nr:hypothetical protein [Nitrososphaerales archaeon]